MVMVNLAGNDICCMLTWCEAMLCWKYDVTLVIRSTVCTKQLRPRSNLRSALSGC